MSPEVLQRLWGPSHAFDHPVTAIVSACVAAALVATPLATLALAGAGKLDAKTKADIWTRYWTWLVLAPAMLAPVLLGAAPTMLMVLVASLLSYREFARATGLFRERLISGLAALGIVLFALSALDNYPRFFFAIPATGAVVIAAAAVLQDRPSGYIQRVGLGVFALTIFGSGLAHLALLANDPGYRPMVCLLIFCVQLNDIFAYICGKAFGRRKLFPQSSPKKTLGGHLGAIALTTPLVMWLGHMVFEGTALGSWGMLLVLGLVISIGGQLGDLILSSIKRDLGVKDLAQTLPGHGGVSDRFNSTLLTAPAMFHLVNHFVGVGPGEPVRIFTGGGW